jgi:hypothetical protein
MPFSKYFEYNVFRVTPHQYLYSHIADSETKDFCHIKRPCTLSLAGLQSMPVSYAVPEFKEEPTMPIAKLNRALGIERRF